MTYEIQKKYAVLNGKCHFEVLVGTRTITVKDKANATQAEIDLLIDNFLKDEQTELENEEKLNLAMDLALEPPEARQA
tara:strand:+ start:1047 stop:1280 length:234 start_codon:yes stop_codon:yes gene_type:complete